MRMNESVIPGEGSKAEMIAPSAHYAVIRRIAKSVNRFSLIHFKARLISGIEIIGCLNTRPSSLKAICQVVKVRSKPQKSTHSGAFFAIFRL
ncbi:hypothetical protein [Pantoea cypripedii]|uniref:hypothetical protein n=1 Tax=Pantoea cypripedii TaxID=55209 RepID=UPI0013019E8F|nr:hypothetical protein [Pantoea cypripedii]MBP2198608.1 hypothetical protein [Pantoea cypripedii]